MKYPNNETKLLEILNQDPENPEIWFKLGLIREEKGDYEGAKKAYQQTIKCNPEDNQAWVGLGTILEIKDQEYQKAERAYRNAIKFSPDDTLALMKLANLLTIFKQEYDEAEELYNAILDIDSYDANIWFLLALNLRLNKKIGKAKETFERALELNPLSEKYWYYYSIFLLEYGSEKDAENAIKKTLEINNKYEDLWVSLGMLYENMDPPKKELAIDAYTEALELYPFDTRILKKLLRAKNNDWYIPIIVDGVPKKKFAFGRYSGIIVGDIINYEKLMIKYQFLMFLYERGSLEPFMFISSEKNALSSENADDSHFFCIFTKEGRSNFGCSNLFADLEYFTKEVLKYISLQFDMEQEKIEESELFV